MKFKIAFVLCILAICVSTIALAVFEGQLNRDTSYWADAAQKTEDPVQISANLVRLQAGLDKWKILSGRTIFMPFDMFLLRDQVSHAVDLAGKLSGVDRSAAEYGAVRYMLQSNLGVINFMCQYIIGYWLVHGGLLWLMLLLGGFGGFAILCLKV